MNSNKFIPALSFKFLTPIYDGLVRLFGYGLNQRIDLIKRLSIKDNDYVLDVGTGTGSNLLALKLCHPNLKVAAIDPDPEVLEIARKKLNKYKNIELIKASASNLPVKDSSADIVISTLVFHHLPADVKSQAISEIYRVLKPNGRFLLVDFGANRFARNLYWLMSLVRLPEAASLQANVQGQIPNLLKQAGFKIQQIAPTYRGIEFLLAEKLVSK